MLSMSFDSGERRLKKMPWKNKVLVVVNTMLGIESVNPRYYD